MSDKTPSQLRSDTARANGAKSRGPKSAATREISSRNSLRHGLTACNTLVLSYECQADFDQTVARYIAIHQPANAEEEGLVKDMISAHWRIQRFGTAETALIDLEMIRQQPELEEEFAHADPAVLLALAIKSLADGSRTLSLISRYESRLQRTHERARKGLHALQDKRKKENAEKVASQPEPTRPEPAPEAATPKAAAPPSAPAQPEAQSPAAAPRLCNKKSPCKKKMQKRTQAAPPTRRFSRRNRSLSALLRTLDLPRRRSSQSRQDRPKHF